MHERLLHHSDDFDHSRELGCNGTREISSASVLHSTDQQFKLVL